MAYDINADLYIPERNDWEEVIVAVLDMTSIEGISA